MNTELYQMVIDAYENDLINKDQAKHAVESLLQQSGLLPKAKESKVESKIGHFNQTYKSVSKTKPKEKE